MNIAFSTVGLFRCVRLAGAATPSASGLWSTNPLAGSWQVAQETLSFTEMRLSLKSFSPSATFSGVGSDPAGTASSYSTGETPRGRLLGTGADAAVLSAATAAVTRMVRVLTLGIGPPWSKEKRLGNA